MMINNQLTLTDDIYFKETVQLIDGHQGMGLQYKGVFLHDPQGVLSEAENFIANLKISFETDLILVLGLGLGWHLKVLQEKFPKSLLAVWEPEPNMDKLALKKGFYPNNNFIFFADGSAYESFIDKEILAEKNQNIALVIWPAYKKLFPKEVDFLHDTIRKKTYQKAVIKQTKAETDENYLNNIVENSFYLAQYPDFGQARDVFKNKGAAFVVGAAPSLDINGCFLKEAQNKGLIIAAASALKPLLKMKVKPDVLVLLESRDTSSFIDLSSSEKEFLGNNCYLALASGVHPAHFDIDFFVKGIFHLNLGESSLFGSGQIIPQGGTSGSAAFALAYHWGLSPLVLIAQDQAYGQGKLHACGTPGLFIDEEVGEIELLGLNGQKVSTNSAFWASLSWYEEAAKNISTKKNHPKLYNASAEGAFIKGFEQIELSFLINKLALIEKIDLNKLCFAPSLKKDIRADLEQYLNILISLQRLALCDWQKALVEVQQLSEINVFFKRFWEFRENIKTFNDLRKHLEKLEKRFLLILSKV